MPQSAPWTRTFRVIVAAMLLTVALLTVPPYAHAEMATASRQTDAPAATSTPVEVQTVFSGLENPWGLEFLPDGRFLVTERPGNLRIIAADGGNDTPVSGVPEVVARGQGGLLDVTLSPDFADTGRLYLAYSEPAGGGKARTAVARATLDTATATAPTLKDREVIFRQEPAVRSSYHFGSRIVVAPDGSLFVTTGDRGAKQQSQDPANTIGVLARILPDGSPHPDNPRKPGWAPEVYSYGHRNIQGAVFDAARQKLWTVEHGARGGDELNAPQPGVNHGWPVITYGRDYSGEKIGVGTKKEGLAQPVYYWDPSIAVSGLEVVGGKLFTGWKGNLLVGGLAGSQLARLVLDDTGSGVVAEEKLLAGEGYRVRDVREGPDGAIYVVTDESIGALLRITPKL